MNPHDINDLSSYDDMPDDVEDHLNVVHGHRKVELMGMGYEAQRALHNREHVSPLAQYAITYLIPAVAANQDRSVVIGPCVYGRWGGVFAYKVYGDMDVIGLKRDGTWHKYGDDFGTPEKAYETLLATTHRHWGD